MNCISNRVRTQKTFTVDFLTKKKKLNEGEVPQYYIEQSHEAIIEPEEWDAVQDEIRRRKSLGRAYSGISVLGAKIVCGDCGGWYGHKTWHSTDQYRTSIWQCNRKFKEGKQKCQTPHITEDEIKRRFLEAYNQLILNRDVYLETCLTAKTVLADTTEIDVEMDSLLQELEVVTELTKKLVAENATTALDQKVYLTRYNGYVERYEKAKARYDDLAVQRDLRIAKGKAIERFMMTLAKRESCLTEFDNRLWLTTLDTVTVEKDGRLLFRFFDGSEIYN